MNFIHKKAFVFDLDYTLYDEHDYFFGVLKIFCEQNRLNSFKLKKMKEVFLLKRNKSKNIFKELLTEIDFYCDQNFDSLFSIYISAIINLKIYSDAKKFLDFLKGKNKKIGIITNGNPLGQKNKIKNLKIEKYFDYIIYARDHGKEKPDVSSYNLMRSLMKVNSEEIVYIGDNPTVDFLGAKKAGYTTVRILRGINKKIPYIKDIDLEIRSFMELMNYE